MTRRIFAKILSGCTAAATTCTATAQNVIQHTILRRPYKVEHHFPAKPYMLVDSLHVGFSTVRAPVRVTAWQETNQEPVLQVTTVPKPMEDCMFLGLHGCRAEWPIKIVLESRKEFTVHYCGISNMYPAFRREGGMIIYHDQFYKPHPETGMFGQSGPHHRKVFGPGKDVGYR